MQSEPSCRARRKRSLIIGFGSKRSYHRIQNDHDPGQQGQQQRRLVELKLSEKIENLKLKKENCISNLKFYS